MKRLRTNRITERMYYHLLFPAVLSAFGSAFADMADAVVVGQRMGETGLAAVAICLPVFNILNIAIVSLSAGGSVIFAENLARGNRNEGNAVFSQVMFFAAALGTVLAALGMTFIEPLLRLLGATSGNPELYRTAKEYAEIIICASPLFFISYILNAFLRNDDNQDIAAAGFFLSCITDIALNIVFVLILDMGAKGAAWSTVIGNAVAVLLYLSAFYVGKFRKSLSFVRVRPDAGVFGCVFSRGFPVAVQYICALFFLNAVNRILLKKGGTTAVAIFDVLYNTAFLVNYLFLAAANAMQPLVTTFRSERNASEEKRSLSFGLHSGLILGGVLVILIELFPGILFGVFGVSSAGALEIGIPALRLYAVSLVIGGISCIYATYYQAIGDSRKSFLITFLRTGALLIPAVVFFSLPPLKYFWLSFAAVELITLNVILFFRLGENAFSFGDPDRVMGMTIRNDSTEFRELLENTERFCERWGRDAKQSFLIYSAVEEICAIIRERAMKDSDGIIQLTMVALEDGDVELHVRDTADKFNPFALQTKRAAADGDFDVSVMGILILKKKAKKFYYRQFQGFNVLVIRV